MNGGQLPTNQLHDINWGALDHASRAPQLMSCNYYVCVRVCVYMYVCMKVEGERREIVINDSLDGSMKAMVDINHDVRKWLIILL